MTVTRRTSESNLEPAALTETGLRIKLRKWRWRFQYPTLALCSGTAVAGGAYLLAKSLLLSILVGTAMMLIIYIVPALIIERSVILKHRRNIIASSLAELEAYENALRNTGRLTEEQRQRFSQRRKHLNELSSSSYPGRRSPRRDKRQIMSAVRETRFAHEPPSSNGAGS